MATLVLPGQAVPTLAVTATATAAAAVRRVLRKRRTEQNSRPTQGVPTAATDEITLEWSDVTCLLIGKDGGKSRTILRNASGIAKPGRIMAVLGPSGSGKSTLLNALAGRVPASGNLSLHGSVTINGVSIDDVHVPTAYVTQEDIFFSQLTVRETIDIAAAMRLPRDISAEERRSTVDDLIRKLGLVDVADTRVGDEKDRGISGGEKKRLSLGIELISTPRLILCDEPTSGLDAFQAERVMSTLRSLAEAGHTVICSVHQPSGTIFSMFDDMVLLAGGRQVYSGPTDTAPKHFESLGHPLPKQSNPAEHYLEIISVDYTSEETINKSFARIDRLVEACPAPAISSESPKESTESTNNTNVVATRKRMGPLGQIGVLFVRAWKQITRDKKTNISRFMSSLMSALLFGAIYWRLGWKQRTIQDRLGLLQVCTVNTAMSTLVKTLNVFPREAVLVNRERVRGSYNVFEYLSSKLAAELPISAFFPLMFSLTVYPMAKLAGGAKRIARFVGITTLEAFTAASYGLAIGALVPSTDAALAIGPSSFVLQVVFGGLYITERSVPKWASWLPRVSIIKHAYEALCVNEFRGLKFEKQHSYDVSKGEQVLRRLSWGDSSVVKCCLSQARVLAFNYLLTYSILTLKKPRFAELKPALTSTVRNEVAVDEENSPEQAETTQDNTSTARENTAPSKGDGATSDPNVEANADKPNSGETESMANGDAEQETGEEAPKPEPETNGGETVPNGDTPAA